MYSSIRSVINFFWGIHKAPNFREILDQLLRSDTEMGFKISLKIHFLYSHLDFFPDDFCAVSDEKDEHFDQDNTTYEKRYQGKWSAIMLADYCWTLKKDIPDVKQENQQM